MITRAENKGYVPAQLAEIAAEANPYASPSSHSSLEEEADATSDPGALVRRVSQLEQRIRALEARTLQTQLTSESFLARAFAVLGHVIVAYALLWIPLVLLIILFSGGAALFG